MEEGVVVSLAEGYRAVARARGHELVLDEPAEVGGADHGPTPVEALLAALGACTAMTLRMYAERKGWVLRGVRVRLDHARMKRADCLDCPPDADLPLADRIATVVEIDADLDDAQLERLDEIARRCPVHRLLHGATVVTEVRRA